VYLRDQERGFELELTINKDRSVPYEQGEGYGHLAMSVGDLDAEHIRLSALGFNPTLIKELENSTERIARFFFITDPDGYKVEILQRGGRYL